MGCGVSNKVSQARDPIQNLSGQFNITLQYAKLDENLGWIGLIEAYVIMYFGKRIRKSEISKKEGCEPVWNQEYIFQKISEDEMIYLEVWNDHSILDDQFLGSAAVSLLDIRFGGEKDILLDLYDNKKNTCGKIKVSVQFQCNYPNNPLAQQIDYAGFITVKIRQVNINRDQEIPNINMTLLAQVSICNRIIGQTNLAIDQGQQPIWDDTIVGYREVGEDIIEISIFDCNQQTEFELIGSAYSSICRALSNVDKRKVVIWWQGKSVGMLQVEISFHQSTALSRFLFSAEDYMEYQNSNYDEEWKITTELAYEKKKKSFQQQQEDDINMIRDMKKQCNRPELNLERQQKWIWNEYQLKFNLNNFKQIFCWGKKLYEQLYDINN